MGNKTVICISFIIVLFLLISPAFVYSEGEDGQKPVKKAAKPLDKTAVRELKSKLKAVRELARNNKKNSPEVFLSYLGDANSVIRAEALKGVVKCLKKGTELTPEMAGHLEDALNDTSPDVIVQAAAGLQKNASKKSEAKLLQAFRNALKRKDGYDIAVRTAIIRALGTCGDAKTGKALKLLAGQMNCGIGIDYDNAVTEALGALGDPKALKILRARLDDLLAHKPTEDIALKPWEEAVRITREVIAGLEAGKEAEHE